MIKGKSQMANKKKNGTTTAIVNGKEKTVEVQSNSITQLDRISGKPILDMSKLEPHVRQELGQITLGLQQAFTDVRKGFLIIGKLLTQAEVILKQRGSFVAYLNSFGSFKQAQAYRYINGYKMAQLHYPEAVLESILGTGLDMIGTKDRPFGKYQEVVKQLPPPKDADAGKAQQWLNKVVSKYEETRKTNNKTETTPLELQKEAYNAIIKRYDKVPAKKQLAWIRELFGYILGTKMGMKQDETIEPMDAPANFVKAVKQESDVAAAEEGE